MDRNFLKQSIRRELDYYKDGLFNEDEDEYWERAWAAPDDDDSMAENGFLNVAMAHLQGDEWKERKTARLPGQRVRLPRDGFPHDECEMPGLP